MLILVYKTIDNLSIVFSYIINTAEFTICLLNPFIYAFIIAYFLNPFVRFFEENLFKRDNKYLTGKKKRRGISILIIYLVIILLFSLIINYIIPVITLSMKDLAKSIPDYLENNYKYVQNIPSWFSLDKYIKLNERIPKIIKEYTENMDIYQFNRYLEKIIDGILKLTVGFLKALLGFIIAIYILMDKENIKKGCHRVLTAFFRENKANKIINVFNRANRVFSRFLIGKSFDSFIVGIICYITMLIFRVRYALLISVIIGISNMIPYFGPIFGAVPTIIITLLYSPEKAFLAAFLLFIIQQFDGNYLEPKILGDSLGISPLWIIFAILAGGGIFGVFGMFIGVPAVAVMKSFFDDWVEKRLEEKE